MKPFVALTNVKLPVQALRAVLLVKLVQMLKLKKNCSKASADFILLILNSETDAPEEVSPLRNLNSWGFRVRNFTNGLRVFAPQKMSC